MKKLLVPLATVVLVALLVTSSFATVQTLITNRQDDNGNDVFLTISRANGSDAPGLAPGTIWRWIFNVTNESPSLLESFSVPLLVNDIPLSVTSGVYQNYMTDTNGTPFELHENATWLGTNLVPLGTTGTFSFDTSLPDFQFGDYQARDNLLVARWLRLPTPSPVVPEPMTLILGSLGLGTLAGLKRLRKA